MADKSPKPYLICYDISCPKRLGRLHRHIKKRATPLQLSVFEAELTPSDLNRLLREMGNIINPKEDDLRVYPIQRHTEIATLGPAFLPDGIHRFGLVQLGGKNDHRTAPSGNPGLHPHEDDDEED